MDATRARAGATTCRARSARVSWSGTGGSRDTARASCTASSTSTRAAWSGSRPRMTQNAGAFRRRARLESRTHAHTRERESARKRERAQDGTGAAQDDSARWRRHGRGRLRERERERGRERGRESLSDARPFEDASLFARSRCRLREPFARLVSRVPKACAKAGVARGGDRGRAAGRQVPLPVHAAAVGPGAARAERESRLGQARLPASVPRRGPVSSRWSRAACVARRLAKVSFVRYRRAPVGAGRWRAFARLCAASGTAEALARATARDADAVRVRSRPVRCVARGPRQSLLSFPPLSVARS